MVRVFRFGHLGVRDPTLFNYLLKETYGDKKEFDETVKRLWPAGDYPKGTEEVRRYFFQVLNPKVDLQFDYKSLAVPCIVKDLNFVREFEGSAYELVRTDFFGQFSELKNKLGELEFDPRVLDEGLRRFKLNRYWGKKLSLDDILVVRGEHIVDYIAAKKTEELKKILEGVKLS